MRYVFRLFYVKKLEKLSLFSELKVQWNLINTYGENSFMSTLVVTVFQNFGNFTTVYPAKHIAAASHQKIEKEIGLNKHVERLNDTIRHRFSRLVIKSLSFS
ncbi:MAG: hypothetical protein CFE22_17500, partial [Cytophagaceae bacterium BCCC1]